MYIPLGVDGICSPELFSNFLSVSSAVGVLFFLADSAATMIRIICYF